MRPKLGIIAGGGELPHLLVEHCKRNDRPYFVIALKGQAEPGSFDQHHHTWVRIGAAGEALKLLREQEVEEVILVGAVTKPSLGDLRPDMWTARFLSRIGEYQRGDDSLLRAVIDELEDREGFRVTGVEEVVPELLAPAGVLTSATPDQQGKGDIEVAFAAARELGRRDLGQAAVAANGVVIAKEERAGTVAMLDDMPPGSDGVLVKVSKPDQERRVDLPTIGPQTISRAAAAGLRGIAVEAGSTIIIDRDETSRAADEAGLFLVGVDPTETASDSVTHPIGIYLIAGEPSADLLGAALMAALKENCDHPVDFTGIGGPEMQRQGLRSLFPMEDLAVMGLAEVLPRIPALRRRILQTVADVVKIRPDALVTIDSPDFSFRVARRLHGKGIPLIHFVAPSVWAWRPKRAQKIAKFLDHVLCLLPFEPSYFEREGLSATYVGHPVLEGGGANVTPDDVIAFRRKHQIAEDENVLVMLPGSRAGEARRLLPIFEEVVRELAQSVPRLRVVTVPASPTRSLVSETTRTWDVPITYIDEETDKFAAFAAARAALAASGTVAVELALTATPAIITYKLNPVTAWIAKRLIKTSYVNLINILIDRPAIPELLAGDCRTENIVPALVQLFRDEEARAQQLEAYEEGLSKLGRGERPASAQAAHAVLEIIGERSGSRG